ncbi:hypothetical protein MES4922_40030 [Mesorhizobium ventifaucium]|uniref:Uncharacterized protein n=1 Tax=Mesorhizobium ventifaucium TaxID=666020 RepID=A0ABN8K677_9HYPH|nr:hypothetical protein MES4922_40030 [Mesorhizobium ventifaucium]
MPLSRRRPICHRRLTLETEAAKRLSGAQRLEPTPRSVQKLQGERSALARRLAAGRRRDAGDDLDLEIEAGKPVDAYRRPVRIGRSADLFRPDGQHRFDLFVRVGVEGGDVDNVVEAAPGGGQDRAQIGEGPPNLILEFGLGRAVLTAPDLTRHEEKIAGANGRGISMDIV